MGKTDDPVVAKQLIEKALELRCAFRQRARLPGSLPVQFLEMPGCQIAALDAVPLGEQVDRLTQLVNDPCSAVAEELALHAA